MRLARRSVLGYCKAMRRQRWSALILLVGLVALGPLAHLSPPDPTWLGGWYDAADYDDVVLAVTSTASAVDGSPLEVLRPSPIVLGRVLLPVPADGATAPHPAVPIRAPPVP